MDSFFLNILLDPPDFVINQPWMHLVGVFNKHSIKLVKLQSSSSSFLLLLQSSIDLIFCRHSVAKKSQFGRMKMPLWDPEAAGNVAQYLRLLEIALFEIRNALFIGVNAVLVPNSETGYRKGFHWKLKFISSLGMMMRRMFGPVMVLSRISWIISLKNEKMFLKNISTTQWMQFLYN